MINFLSAIIKKYTKTYWLISKTLSKNHAHAFFLYTKILFFSIFFKRIKNNSGLNFFFYFNNKKFKIKLMNDVDLGILHEVFVLQEYNHGLDKTIKTVLDLGAHWGDTSIYYALLDSVVSVYAVEPMPQAFGRLENNSLEFTKIKPYNYAVGSTNSKINFYISSETVNNSTIRRDKQQQVIEVNSVDFSNLLKIIGVNKFDIVKFDIEGAEQFIFKDPSFLTVSDMYIGELHLKIIPYSLDDISNIFSDFIVTYSKVKEDLYIMQATRKI